MPFTTVSGNYYVGMSRAKATDKKEFDRIDKNKDKILQGNEICDERDLECSAKMGEYIFTTTTLLGTGAGLAATTSATGPFGLIAGGGCLLASAGYYFFADDGSDAMKKTEIYRKEHNISIFKK